MLPTLVLTSTAILIVATILLVAVGRRVRFASRLAGVLFAALVCYAVAELLTRVFGLVPSYVLAGAATALVISTLVVFGLPHWNPVGQLFLGAYLTGATPRIRRRTGRWRSTAPAGRGSASCTSRPTASRPAR